MMVFLMSLATLFHHSMVTLSKSPSIKTLVNFKLLFYFIFHNIKILYFVVWFFELTDFYFYFYEYIIGSGFNTSNRYKYGLFSAKIKLPSNYTAGVCVTFYVSTQILLNLKAHDLHV